MLVPRNYNIYFSKASQIRTIVIFIFVSLVGIWLVYDGAFVSFSEPDERLFSRVTLKTYTIINIIEFLTGSVLLFSMFTTMRTQIITHFPKRRPALVISDEGIWVYHMLGMPPVSWEVIKEAYVENPQMAKNALLVVNFKNRQSWPKWYDNHYSMDLYLDGFDCKPEEVQEAIDQHFIN